MTLDAARAAFHRQALAALGAAGEVLESLVAYTDNPFDLAHLGGSPLPLPDRPQMDAWDHYVREAEQIGVLPALSKRLVQLRFPIAEGISQTEAYRAATRRGIPPAGDRAGVTLEQPEGLELVLRPTLAGRIPTITCRTRNDFVSLVRALSCRNEPETVPASMGACFVNGLNNWDRVARLRRRMEAERGAAFDEMEWKAAFADVIPQKLQYQDCLIILSREPYSAVPATALGISDADWRAQSVNIRAEHECTHYFTLLAFGSTRNNLLDEFVADFAGLARTYGRYDADLALRFFGLEAFPEYRAGGRFENYLAAPPVGPEAAVILREILVRAARHVEAFTANVDLATPSTGDRMIAALAGTTLVELASADAADRLRARLAAAPAVA
jgi:hypothetical protein